MIDVKTVKFIKMLDDLAELTKNGIEEFENATKENANDKIFYNKKSIDERGGYRVVLDKCIIDDPECLHHEFVSYYDSNTNEYTVRVVLEENENPYIVVEFVESDEQILIEDGRWYFT